VSYQDRLIPSKLISIFNNLKEFSRCQPMTFLWLSHVFQNNIITKVIYGLVQDKYNKLPIQHLYKVPSIFKDVQLVVSLSPHSKGLGLSV
jgi:hypothetical protein